MEDSRDMGLGPAEKRVSEAVRELPRVEADPAFRLRLRREFATGQWTTRPAPVLPAPLWLRAVRWSALPAAAAFVFLLAAVNRGPDWTVIATTSAGQAMVDGVPVSLADAGSLGRALRRGAEVLVPDSAEVTLLSPGTLLVQIAPGTEMTLPDPPGRWFGKNLEARVDRGEARLLTGPQFPGRRLTIETPAGTTQVTGTLVSVVSDGPATCVCVTEGTAWVGKTRRTMEAIPPGMRKLMFTDKRPSVVLPIEPLHSEGLTRLLREHGGDIRK